MRLCCPGHWRSLGDEEQGWLLHGVMMKLPLCLVLLHVSVILQPSELKPKKSAEACCVCCCHYWTTYKCCGLQDWQQKEMMFLFLTSEKQRSCAHIKCKTYQSNLATVREWNMPCWFNSSREGDLWSSCLPLHFLSFWVHAVSPFCHFYFPIFVPFYDLVLFSQIKP